MDTPDPFMHPQEENKEEEDSIGGTVLRHVVNDPKDGRPVIRYRIQTIDESMRENVLDILVNTFLVQENICSSLDIRSSEVATEDLVNYWKYALSCDISLVAVLEESDGSNQPGYIIGLNVLKLEKRDDDYKVRSRSEPSRKLFESLDDCASVDVFKHFDSDRFVNGAGLLVLPDYRKRSIGFELLKARELVCKTIDCPFTATVFTGVASQSLAEKCGFKTLSSLDLSTYSKDGEVVYPKYQTRYMYWMARRYF